MFEQWHTIFIGVVKLVRHMDQIKMDSVVPVSDVAYGTFVKPINYLPWFDCFKQILCYVYTYTRDITNCMPPVWSGYFIFQCMSFLLWLECDLKKTVHFCPKLVPCYILHDVFFSLLQNTQSSMNWHGKLKNKELYYLKCRL